MFTKSKRQNTDWAFTTDVIKKEKSFSRYKHLLNIVRTIRMLFVPKDKTLSNK